MYSGKLALTNRKGLSFSLSNDFSDVYELKESVMECKTVSQLLMVIMEQGGYNPRVAKDINLYTRLEYSDVFGNTHYLLAYKEA